MLPLLSLLLSLLIFAPASHAQSVSESLPPEMDADAPDADAPVAHAPAAPATPSADTYTVTDVNVDVTADTATHARDQALMQAERSAYATLCARLGAADSGAKLNDDGVAALVQSFELQSERLSPVRYIGVFTIRFNPAAVTRKFGAAAVPSSTAPDATNPPTTAPAAKPAPPGPQTQITAAVVTESLAAWTQIKRRLLAVPQIARVDTLDLGRGLSHIGIAYTGTLPDLQQALTNQGLILRQNQIGVWELTDGSMVPR